MNIKNAPTKKGAIPLIYFFTDKVDLEKEP